MRAPNFDNNQFLDQTALNDSFDLVSDSLEDITSSLHTPGLVGASNLSFSYSGLNILVSAPLPFRALFSDGTLASANGTTDGSTSSSATVDFSSLVPSTGSITAYLVVSSGSVAQEAYSVPGPPVGHPDYNANFAPYTAYAEVQDTLIFSATTTAPDNETTLFIASTVLSAGQTTITSSSTVGQLYAGAILTQDVSIIGTLEVGDTLTAASAQINGNATITGTASASAGTSGDQLVNYTQLTNGSIDADFDTLTASSAQINGNATVNGLFTANYNIKGQTLTYNNTGLTVGWNFTNGQGEVDLLLGSQGGVGGLNIYQLNSSGDMVSTTPILALSNAGQLTIQGEAIVAPATQNNAAVPYGQAFQLLTPTASETITLRNTLKTEVMPNTTAAATFTLEPGSVVGQSVIFYGNSNYGVTVQSNVTTGSPYFALPNNSDIYSWTIPTSSQQGIELVWDGGNWRARTFGQEVVAPATQNNAAVQLGQVLATSPLYNGQGFTPASGDSYTISNSFTAPCNGYILAASTINESGEEPAAGTNTISINGTAYGTDSTVWPMTDWGAAAVSAGTACTVTSTYTAGSSTGTFVAVSQTVMSIFIPNP